MQGERAGRAHARAIAISPKMALQSIGASNRAPPCSGDAEPTIGAREGGWLAVMRRDDTDFGRFQPPAAAAEGFEWS